MRNFDAALIQQCTQISGISRIEFLKELAFILGSFILPKYMMKSFEAEVPEAEEGEGVFPASMATYFDQVLNELYEGQPHENYGVTHDFFHILSKVTLDDKKARTLETYKLIFRFSIEKMTNFL